MMEAVKPNLTAGARAREVERQAALAKGMFETNFSRRLHLMKVSAPLFVAEGSGINDNLNGWERAVSFDAAGPGEDAPIRLEVVQSLAKWKRLAARYYDFGPGEGLYTDMRAIRRDEEVGPLHSYLVDQWDWEKVITREERHTGTLQAAVALIYEALKETEAELAVLYPELAPVLPDAISFMTTQELENRYPGLTPKEREHEAARETGAVFLLEVGGKLASGEVHDGRSPDYDDWRLNGDLIVWNPVLGTSFELSSMGIRVDEAALLAQLRESGCEDRLSLPFHRMLMNGELPCTMGGGIGQSRVAMFLLRKAHIGEVQMSVWPGGMAERCRERGIELLNAAD
ncbi:AsnA [Paenibacillus mucilaginosus 3016]|uniref:Aspartate--ammonia ligase n=1 Tax=Paenibacillus mucilaginosus 3016 TaxID=1116391 RepID=H6NC95_9BACL|nr:aspartate--ammonia ligase [Paenibacillus mucilaginosus]AFC28288.1 AsnA [Paenibacillus mucilaginosus 3016]WFA17096.1 aspartate--ammonia ligase [Paenibacillus mucilaginosus]